MSDIKITNIPSMDVGKMVETLSNAYSQVIRNELPVTTMPSVMLWGPPGVGKSQAVRQIAGRIEKNTTKKVNVTDVRLLLFNPIDLRGIPTGPHIPGTGRSHGYPFASARHSGNRPSAGGSRPAAGIDPKYSYQISG